jgi:signal transduction histidine kinase
MLFVLLTSSVYFFISRNLYADMKAGELRPKAESIGQFYLMYRRQLIPPYAFLEIVSAGPSAWDAWVFVIDKSETMLVQSKIPEDIDPDESFVRGISQRSTELLLGNEIRYVGYLPNSRTGMMIIGVPVYDADEVIGGVFLAKPMVEINDGINILNGALLLSALICVVVMIIPTIYAVNRVLRPLKETRAVAMAMASGDFSVRAGLIPKGEIGDLASSINLLADRLEKTVSDLVFEKNRLIRILNGLAEGIIAVDVRCNVTHANPALWKLIHSNTGSRATCDLPQHNQRAIMLRPDNPQFIRKQLISDDSVWEDFRNVIHTSVPVMRDLYQNETIIRIMITPIEDENGVTVGAVGLFQDVTESEWLEQTRKDYVANISHELRTPLTAMRGLIEPLADGLVSQKTTQQKYYEIILRETMRLSRLIDDMLELSRLQSGKITIELQTIDLYEIVQDVLDKFRKTAEDKDVLLSASERFQTLMPLIGHPDRIEQVLIILIDNAIKFTPAGKKVVIDVSPADSKKTPDKVLVSVIDNGDGIDPKVVKNVFERFFKANKARVGTEGTGLGLSIAKEILHAMGEEISVKSKLGEGSTFTFTLKVKK